MLTNTNTFINLDLSAAVDVFADWVDAAGKPYPSYLFDCNRPIHTNIKDKCYGEHWR